jgi:hypothetical protein
MEISNQKKKKKKKRKKEKEQILDGVEKQSDHAPSMEGLYIRE